MDHAAVLSKVVKSYRKGQHEVLALAEVDLQIDRGQFVALMGPSGSGKSTLLHLLGGLDRADRGTVNVAGIDLTQLNESQLTSWRKDHVGFIFQQYHLVPVLTAAQNVELPLTLFSLSRSERRKRVGIALEIVGLADRADHRPNMLSGGQEQRVAIARALVTDPALLLADEPTGDLDARNAEEILRLLELLNHELHKTIVMVTHDPKAAQHATRQIHLEKGNIVQDHLPTRPQAG